MPLCLNSTGDEAEQLCVRVPLQLPPPPSEAMNLPGPAQPGCRWPAESRSLPGRRPCNPWISPRLPPCAVCIAFVCTIWRMWMCTGKILHTQTHTLNETKRSYTRRFEKGLDLGHDSVFILKQHIVEYMVKSKTVRGGKEVVGTLKSEKIWPQHTPSQFFRSQKKEKLNRKTSDTHKKVSIGGFQQKKQASVICW